MIRAGAALLIGAGLGCSRADRVADSQPAPSSSQAECVAATREKLGVAFVRMCGASSFWISTTPIGCSAGEHGTLRCAPVVALAEPGRVEPASQLAAVVDADTANRLCAMRFAGRLPTRAERVRARSELGLATIVVYESEQLAARRFQELAEWVTERPCDQPTELAPECGVARFPWEATPHVAWRSVVRCWPSVAPSEGRALVGLDGACVPGDACMLRGVADDTPKGSGVLVTCARPDPTRAQPELADVAAIRCVLPEWI